MARVTKVRVKRNDESMEEYVDNIKKEYNIDDVNSEYALIHYDSDKGEVIQANFDELFESLPTPSKQTKKINFWIEEDLLEDLKDFQNISGGITLTEAIKFIIKEFFDKYKKTEKYQLYIKFKDQIQK